ncbi:MAG: bifunctional phosphopantothenoylcysteine decarboxylase/phosphopantothenate--cysteine ligase CoaBC [Eubacteriales bacterium]|nr:bifunctional phosphopantothenoylcysteine decarboxylase/phosphopantothenate--cysteine ligase CoaBC [Eubacteriales bacterium]
MLKDKVVLLGVTGGIAAYKIASLASSLVKAGATVHVIMTDSACNFINPITFETLTGNKCIIDTFDRNFDYDVEHVSLAKKADVFMIAPATANTIAKIARGLADNMLTTTFLACKAPKIIVPSMNTNMYENPITQNNLELLKNYGMDIIQPDCGHLACGDTGTGKMPEPNVLLKYIEKAVAVKDMTGLKVLVTAGPTRESMDPVRYITNHSTGKMGYAIAKECMERGAEVTLVSGPTSIEPPVSVKLVNIVSAENMYDQVISCSQEMDIIIKSAAVADYRPANVCDQKVKKKDDDLSIPMARTKDILKALGENRRADQFLCGFSMETENMIENSRKKLIKKNIDMIIANNLKDKGAGFGTDTNLVTMISKDTEKALELMTKEEVAKAIIDEILLMRRK